MAGTATLRVEVTPESVKYIRAPDGPVGRYLMVVADKIKVETIASLKAGFPRDWLGPNIVKRTISTPSGPMVQVGSTHIKTRPHVIRGNPTLSFPWAKGEAAGAPGGPDGNGLFHFAFVNHPGSDFAKYLQGKLNEALEKVAHDL